MILDNNYDFFIVKYDDKLVAYIILLKTDVIEIISICTDKEYRCMGFAKRLLEHVTDYYSEYGKLILEVRSKNSGAIHLYESCGFYSFGERKDYYNNPDDNAIIFIKDI